MALSRPSTDVIALGKRLSEELSLSKSCETLCKWMAQLLAEKITALATTESSDERQELEQQIVELTLSLWRQRYCLPSRVSPFSKLTKAVDYLAALQDEKTNAWPWIRVRDQVESPWRTFVQSVEAFSSQSVSLLVLSEAILDLDSDALAWEEENEHMLERLELDALRLLQKWMEKSEVNEATEPHDQQPINRAAADKATMAVSKVEALLQQLQKEFSVFKDQVFAQYKAPSN